MWYKILVYDKRKESFFLQGMLDNTVNSRLRFVKARKPWHVEFPAEFQSSLQSYFAPAMVNQNLLSFRIPRKIDSYFLKVNLKGICVF